MVVTESVTESVFSKTADLSYNHESLTINGNDRDCAGALFSKFLFMSDNGRVYDRFCGEVFPGLSL